MKEGTPCLRKVVLIVLAGRRTMFVSENNGFNYRVWPNGLTFSSQRSLRSLLLEELAKFGGDEVTNDKTPYADPVSGQEEFP